MKNRHVAVRAVAVLFSLLLAIPAGLVGASSSSAATTKIEHETPGKEYISLQDEYFDLYVNGAYIGAVNNPPGGTTCHYVTLRAGSNTIELRITNSSISNTALKISINNGEFERDFSGDNQSYSWTITA